MTPERWLRVKDIYHAASECVPAEREALLGESCGADADLRREVESLLAEDGSRAGVLDGPAVTQTGAGTQIGPYRITASIGKGGMGEVWKARDTRLNRDVAIKFSAQQFTDRFEREARAIAALNHANICTLHDIGPNYLVMELVEGPTLAERIKRGPIPMEEALAIAKQIADALEAAHEKGIVHRDLKPANIKIRRDGSVKVLDFGIARATSEAAGVSSDIQTMTEPGMIVGTPGYMPPEQVRGEKVDKRADIWAFGVVLFEMVTGKQPFKGATVSDTLASVMKEEPDLSRAPARTRRLLQRCLEKDPNRRLRDMSGVELLLDDEAVTTAPSPSRLSKAGWVAASVFALVAALLVARGLTGPEPKGAPVTQLSMEIAPAEMLAGSVNNMRRPSRTAMAFSPDGRTVVFAAIRGTTTQLYKRALDSREASAIPGTEGASFPFFSPDGEWVGFHADSRLKKIAMNGGPAVVICDLTDRAWGGLWGASWGTSNAIVLAMKPGLMRVPAAGGIPQVLLPAAKTETYSSPQWLPDEKTVLFTARTSIDWDEARIVVWRLDTGEQRVLLKGGADARYVPTGHLLYMRNAALMAVPFDGSRNELAGQPVALLDEVMQSENAVNLALETGMGQFAVSATGSLIYALGGIGPPQTSTLVRVDRRGVTSELSAPKSPYGGLRVSPDGQRLAFMKFRDNALISDIWVYDMPRGTSTRLTSQADNSWPVWSLDGKRLFFKPGLGSSLEIMAVNADGSGTAEPAFPDRTGVVGTPASLSTDGKWLAHLTLRDDRPWQIWVSPTSGEGKSRLFPESSFHLFDAEFSPDGRWMAYISAESGAFEVYVQAFPGPGEKRRISTGGGRGPVWARNGRELFYSVEVSPGNLRMMEVDVLPGDSFRASAPRVLFEGNWLNSISVPSRSYDITPDGRYFIMARPEPLPDQRVTRLNVVLNWFDELKKRAPRSVP